MHLFFLGGGLKRKSKTKDKNRRGNVLKCAVPFAVSDRAAECEQLQLPAASGAGAKSVLLVVVKLIRCKLHWSQVDNNL